MDLAQRRPLNCWLIPSIAMGMGQQQQPRSPTRNTPSDDHGPVANP